MRRKTQSVPEDLSTDEQMMIRQAIENSKLDTGISDGQEIASIPPGAVYHPTVEEFKDPLVYIAKIRKEVRFRPAHASFFSFPSNPEPGPLQAEQYGICKVVPPPGWNPPCEVDMNSGKRFETKRQVRSERRRRREKRSDEALRIPQHARFNAINSPRFARLHFHSS